MFRLCFAVALSALLTACATTPSPETGPAASDDGIPPKAPARINLAFEAESLGWAVRRIADQSTEGIVLMNGLDLLSVGPVSFKDATLSDVVETLAEEGHSEAIETPYYYFLRPPDYSVLDNVSITPRLSPAFREMTAAVRFGADTPLYNAFALMGHSVGGTIVADNAVAAAATGELSVPDAPLGESLEAVMKSARVYDGFFDVECTAEYVFFHSSNNPARSRILLNEESLDESQRALLERRVNLTLPRAPSDPQQFEVNHTAEPLGEVLDSLSSQLGVTVRTGPGLDKLPVNPVAMRDVRVRTALELLIRQWLLPEFGYELTAGGVVIRHVGQPS